MAVPPDDLTCQEIVELVTDYLDGSLPERQATRFAAHLAHCPECRDHVENMRTAISIAGRVRHASLSPAAQTRLIAAFHGWRSAERV
jgi:anti-sigma factor RsiW